VRAVHSPLLSGPADRVTAVRLLLAVAVAGLAVAAAYGAGSTPALVAVATVALVLDGVDGQVARRTGTASAFGARFDMEVDAFLILVLSAHVARAEGWWVLAIGLARYLLWLAGLVWPWLRRPVPPRFWAKVVAAVQGVVLVVVAAGVLPSWAAKLLLLAALLLLAESFAHQVCTLAGWSLRSVVLTALALALVWGALVLPDRPGQLGAAALARLPVEVPVLMALGVLLRARPRRVLAALVGLLLGLVLVLKVLDLGFGVVLDRRFDPLGDIGYLGPAIGVLADSTGRTVAVLVAIGAGVLAAGLLVGLPLAVGRLLRVAGRHRVTTVRGIAVLAAGWLVATAVGLQYSSGLPVAGTGMVGYASSGVVRVGKDWRDRSTFAREITSDRYAAVPGDRLLRGLRGQDVLLVFVESYGRRAVEGSSFAPRVAATLDRGTRRLSAAGFAARSGFLTSSTFGAASWLAHSTLQSGVWVDSQRRYQQLLGSDRLTLTRAFGRAGWRTVFDVPANTRPWPEGADFYGYDHEYDAGNVGYRGPKLGYATMPDQFTLDAFRRHELAGRPGVDRPPVMAEIDLVSSHHPWTPRFPTVPWDQLGDGSVFHRVAPLGEDAASVFADPEAVKRAYADTIVYSIDTLVSFLQRWPDRDLVLVVLGDHQPHSYVTGRHPGHDVPVSVIAKDPAVLDRIAGWGWDTGLRPSADAPVWRMDDFRDRFLATFGSAGQPHHRGTAGGADLD
jgi:phosphatidylglycerophosphate synthase